MVQVATKTKCDAHEQTFVDENGTIHPKATTISATQKTQYESHRRDVETPQGGIDLVTKYYEISKK